MEYPIEDCIYQATLSLQAAVSVMRERAQKIKEEHNKMTGNLAEHLFIYWRVNSIQTLLDDLLEDIHFLENKSDAQKLFFYTDLRDFEDMDRGKNE